MRRGTLPRPSALRGQGARPPASHDSLRTPPCAHWPSVRSLSSPNQDRFDLYSFSVFSQSVFSLSTSYYYSYSHSLLYLQPHPAGFGPHSDPVLSSCVIGSSCRSLFAVCCSSSKRDASPLCSRMASPAILEYFLVMSSPRFPPASSPVHSPLFILSHFSAACPRLPL